jgi:hypothetical protein
MKNANHATIQRSTKTMTSIQMGCPLVNKCVIIAPTAPIAAAQPINCCVCNSIITAIIKISTQSIYSKS